MRTPVTTTSAVGLIMGSLLLLACTPEAPTSRDPGSAAISAFVAAYGRGPLSEVQT